MVILSDSVQHIITNVSVRVLGLLLAANRQTSQCGEYYQLMH